MNDMPADPFTNDGEPYTGSLDRIEQALTRLAGQIDGLTAFARRNGFRG
jgi:hypothetical protein